MFEWILTICTIVGAIVAMWSMWKSQKRTDAERREQETKREAERAERETRRDDKLDNLKTTFENEIKVVKNELGDVKAVIGNGGIGGMRKNIEDMKLTCAGQVAKVAAIMEEHSKAIERNHSDIVELKTDMKQLKRGGS